MDIKRKARQKHKDFVRRGFGKGARGIKPIYTTNADFSNKKPRKTSYNGNNGKFGKFLSRIWLSALYMFSTL